MKTAENPGVRLFQGLASYLTPEGGERVDAFQTLNGQMPPSAELRSDISWEQSLLARLMDSADGRRVRRRFASQVLRLPAPE